MRRALLAFDLSAIPAGSTVTAVQLTLQLTKTVAGPQSVSLHRLSADWGEGTSNATGEEGAGANATTDSATWRYRFFSSQAWAKRGGDFAAAASASQQVGGDLGPYTWDTTPQLVADVQGWLDGPSTNFGWLLQGDESAMPTAKRFASRENATIASRPRLTVDFSPPGGGAATATPTVTRPADTPTVTAASTATVTATATATATPPVTATLGSSTTPTGVVPTATPTATPRRCVGDCDGSRTVSINELIVGVNIALGGTAARNCPAFDGDGSGTVSISELIAAVSNALNGGCATGQATRNEQ